MTYKLPKLPLLTACAFLAVFVFLFFDFDTGTKLTLFLCFTAIGILCVVFAIKTNKKALLLQVGIICISGITALCSLIVTTDIPKQNSRKYIGIHTVEGYFTSVHYVSEYSSGYYAKITSCDGNKADFNTYIVVKEKLYADNYAKFTLDADFSDISHFEKLNLTAKSFVSKNIFIGGNVVSTVEFSGEKASDIVSAFGILNDLICERIASLLSEDSSGLVCALLFGNKDHLPQTVERDFLTLGITHMLVVSGMNIALIAGEFDLVFKSVIKRKKLRSILCCGICILYMLLCRLSLSVVRAAVMQVIYRLSSVFAREYDSKTSLFLSLGIILTLSPGAIFDTGLLLSFFATLGIIIFSQYTDTAFSKIPSFLHGTLSSLAASFSACLFVLPVSFAVFQCTSLVSPIFTLVFSLFLDFLLYLTPMLLVFSFVPMLDNIVVYICEQLCQGIFRLASVGEVFSDFFVSLSGKSTLFLTLLIVLSVIFALAFKTKTKILKVIPSFLLYFGICIYLLLSSQGDGIYYYTRNNNDAVLINYNNNCTLIDISSGEKTFTKRTKSALIDSPLGSTNIDTYIITHSHFDHLVSVDFLASEGYLSSVYLPEPATNDEITVYRELDQLSNTYGFTLETYTPLNTLSDKFGVEYLFHPPMKYSHGNSQHDVLFFEIFIDCKKIIYAGQNLGDTDFDGYALFGEASAVIIGSHYPALKQNFTYRLFDKSAKLIVSTDEISKNIIANIEKTVAENDKYICVLDF